MHSTQETMTQGEAVRHWPWAVLAALALSPSPAYCEEAPDLLRDPLHVALGAFIINTDTTVRLDGNAGTQGTPVDWEQTFGKGDANRFRMDGYWRFAERHKLRALVFNSSRSDSETFAEDVVWGDVAFPVDARVNGEFKFSIYELAYEYAFLHRDHYELSVSLGMHYTELEAKLAATVTLPEQSISERISDSASVGEPLPVIGLRGTWGLPHNLWIDASGQFFSLSTGGYDGNLQDYKVALSWQPKKWLGVGIGYDSFSVTVDVDRRKFNGKLDWAYRGPMVFYSASF